MGRPKFSVKKVFKTVPDSTTEEYTDTAKETKSKKGAKPIVSFTIDRELAEDLKILARFLGKSSSQVAGEALTYYIQVNEEALQKAKELWRR